MRAVSLQHAITLAKLGHGPISKIAAGAVEVEMIVPSVLKTGLVEAGYTVTYHEGPRDDAPEGKAPVGAWVRVKLDGVIAAQAYSHDEGDALLQAIYAAMREEDARVVIDKKLSERGFEVTPELRQRMESRYIVNGMGQLEQDLNAFPSP